MGNKATGMGEKEEKREGWGVGWGGHHDFATVVQAKQRECWVMMSR